MQWGHVTGRSRRKNAMQHVCLLRQCRFRLHSCSKMGFSNRGHSIAFALISWDCSRLRERMESLCSNASICPFLAIWGGGPDDDAASETSSIYPGENSERKEADVLMHVSSARSEEYRLLFRLPPDEKKIVNRPLAGTIRRGKTEEEDKILEQLLLSDGKQCAEHIMLVDLGRNDVGKVSKSGTVKVEKLMNVERYSHVMHISSTVTGELLDNLSCWDALRAALPAGTVSGAPKVRAMELIDQLEVTRRGPYSGGFGGISFTGDMDIALALRTIVFPTGSRYNTMYSYKNLDRRQEWIAHLQAGAGIVADSDPDDEQRECENKAAALARAIDLAESTFVDRED